MEMPNIYYYLLSAALILICLFIGLAIWRHLRGTIQGRKGRRLAISEYYEIDKMRRLLIVRRDGIEHLLLIGGSQDMVIETNITTQPHWYEEETLSTGQTAPRSPRQVQNAPRRPPAFRDPPDVRITPAPE